MAAELLEAAADGMAQTKCAECGSTKHVLDPHTYQSICAECGAVIEVTFFQSSAKGASGGLEKQGQVVDMKKQRIHEMGGQLPALFVSNNAAKLERKAEGRIKWIAQQLDDDQSKLTNAVTNALRMYVSLSFHPLQYIPLFTKLSCCGSILAPLLSLRFSSRSR